MHPTRDTDSWIPLGVALLMALAVHALLVPGLLLVLGGGGWWQSSVDEASDFGRPLTETSRIAWIPYEDARELLAPERSRTEQPVLQSEADPVPNAPLELDPTPPAPMSEPSPAPPSEAVQSNPSALTTDPAAAGELQARAEAVPFERPSREPSNATVDQPARPTSAPRSDRESPLAALERTVYRISPGQVLTAGDFEIKTALPNYSAITIASAAPRNAVAAITFAPDGRVIEARLLRDTGEANVDAPVLRSLYRWRVTGDRLAEVDRAFTLRFNLIFNESDD